MDKEKEEIAIRKRGEMRTNILLEIQKTNPKLKSEQVWEDFIGFPRFISSLGGILLESKNQKKNLTQ